MLRNPIALVVAVQAALSAGSPAPTQHARSEAEVALPAGTRTDWWHAAQTEIVRSEYHVTWQDSTPLTDFPNAYQAPNRAQDFRTYFTPDGIRLIPRITTEDAVPTWQLGLELERWGRVGALQPAETATVHANGNRIEYRRNDLVEWYVNDAVGLEQGFTIARNLPRTTDVCDSMLCVELAVQGNVAARIDDSAAAIEFVAEGDALVIRLGELRVEDAAGRVLPSWFELHTKSSEPAMRLATECDVAVPTVQILSIVVDDRDAQYPVTIDPLATSPSWTQESNQAGAQFGMSVSTAGDVNGDGYSDVIIGANTYDNGQPDEGRAYVYLGSANGLSSSAIWTAESNQPNALFGFSVSTAGDVNGDGYSDVIVGAYSFDTPDIDAGRVVLYLGSPGGLGTNPSWVMELGQAGERFGRSVSTAGDVNGDGYSDVIVGAPLFDNGQADEGSAFLYLGSASGLASTAAWSDEADQPGARFGEWVSTAGDVNGDGYSDVIVGAEAYDGGQIDEGKAFVYLGSANGLAANPAWSAEPDQPGALFGNVVATAGDVNGDGYSDVVVGAPLYGNGQSGEGRAFAYFGSPSGLGANAAWTAESNQASAMFGVSVATAGDVNGDGYSDVIVGAINFDTPTPNGGRVVVYLGSSAGLGAASAWAVETNQQEPDFGLAVATAGDVNGDGYSDVIVGAPKYDNGQSDEGRVFVYHGSPSGLPASASWSDQSNQSYAWLGGRVAAAGDVNGDGFADVLVGAWAFDNGETDEGRAFLYTGSASGLSASPVWTAESNQSGATFGSSLATAGDVNGDGYSDVIIGAAGYSNGESGEGRAFVYLGSASGLVASAAWTAEANQVGARFGQSVSTAGDVNGDGYSDVIVGAERYDHGETDEGRAFAYYGSASGLAPNPAWSTEANQADAWLGVSVAAAGDVNGDGYSDVIVGAEAFDNGESDEGRAFLFHGSASGLVASASWTAESNQDSARLGVSVSTAGDVNGDGFADVIIGAAGFDTPTPDGGRAVVYLGSASGLSSAPAWTLESNQAGAFLGYSVSTAGDVNGDGYSDVIVGAWAFDTPMIDGGRALVYLGSASGLSNNAAWTAETSQSGCRFGYCVSTAGDVNGDGYSEVIVGAPLYDGPESDEGFVFVYYGNGSSGVPMRLRQRRADDTAPIAKLGAAQGGSFLAKFIGRSPLGRGDGWIAVEAKPLGIPFDGTGLVTTSLLDFGTAGVDANLTIPLFGSGTPYHWRARVLYHRATTPYLVAGRWYSPNDNGAAETDLRAPGTHCSGGVSYCTAGISTLGCVGSMSSNGVPTLGAVSGFTLIASNLDGQKTGLIFYGVNGAIDSVWAAGSTSYLCVKSPVQRMLLLNSGGTTGACNGAIAADWLSFLATHPGALGLPISAGQTVQAQCWYRDPPAPKSTNLSNGLQFTTCP